jgi:DNA-binding MarR family transcriptional regulator
MPATRRLRSRAPSTRETPSVGEAARGTEGHIAYLLRQAQGAVRMALDREFARLGLTSPQFLVLNLLDAYPGASGADLARVAMLTPQTVNLIVRKLEREGLVEKSPHELHGRILQLNVTAAGRARLRECKRRADTVEKRLLALAAPGDEARVRAWLVAIAREFAR